jgi:SAM-dependent methyltransferase
MTGPTRIAPGTGLFALVRALRGELAAGVDRLELEAPDPDTPGSPVAGGWRGWCDLAEALGCRLEAPAPSDDGHVRLRLRVLPPEAGWHAAAGAPEERYADPTGFAAVRKLDHPGFALPLLEALGRVRPPDGGRVLVLGCHRGDEIAALEALDPRPRGLEVVGVDHAPAPLAEARARFPDARFVVADVARLPDDVGRFDLIVAVAVLQSRAIDDRALLRDLVQRRLTPSGGLLLGVPNSRFRGHDVVWGARTRNYAAADLSLLVSDLAVYRRYLHQHRFRTHVGGRYDLLLTAWRTGGGAGAGRGDRRADAGEARDDVGGGGARGAGAAL